MAIRFSKNSQASSTRQLLEIVHINHSKKSKALPYLHSVTDIEELGEADGEIFEEESGCHPADRPDQQARLHVLGGVEGDEAGHHSTAQTW